MIRVGNRRFRKCLICGTHGHPKGVCPVSDYNDELESRASAVITAESLFPNNPAMVEKLKLVQASYEQKTRPLTSADTIEMQVAKLRQAWGIA